ncbi:MAG: hypothetical protein GX963_10045 [Bacteroidales bacterium]|nr:hypothetical protein [Bacteroidales bacterium]
MDKESKEYKEFIRIFKRVQHNAVYFLEEYYNKVNPDKAIELTDEEKQSLFDEFRGVPLFKTGGVEAFEELDKYYKRLEKLKAKGYKDWEIQ